MRKVPASFLALTLIAFYLNSAANAQSFTGTISGIVTDRSGGVVPQASITVVNTDTNSRTTAVSNEDGSYIAPQLPRGNYTLEVTAPGFKKSTRSGIVLQVQQQARVDVQLEVGEVGETIEVFADASLLETSDSTLGKVVDNRRIMDLPLDTRNVFSLIYLTPGVSGSVSTTYGTGYSINGARTSMLDTVVDGVSTGHPTVNGFAGNSTFPPVDAIAEFKLLGANYSAEFGRSLGNITNVVYKSGSNEFHGSAFEFLRNSALDANNFFDNSRGVELASFKRSQFGGHLTGPILRNRTFFLGSYEGLRQRGFDNRTFTVPTELERSGDFSQTFSRNGELIRIFDPFSTRPNPNGSGSVRDLFQNNRIPSSRIDPVAANVMRYYPLPNTQGDPLTNQNNYSRSGSRTFDNDQVDVRVDHNLTDTQRIFGRVSLRQMLNQPAVLFPEEIAVAEGRVNEETIQRSAVFDYTNTLSPSTIVSSRLGFSRSLYIYDNQGLGFKPSSLGLPESIDAAVDRQMFPRFGAGGYVNLGGNDHRYNAFMNYSLTGSLTKIVGAHTLKAGYEGRMIRVNVWEARSAGTFNFSSQFTQGPDPTRASATAGNSIASLLLGTGTSGNVLIQNWKNVAAQSFYHGAYVQDDWRVTSKLTLNLGLRYDIDLPRTERYDRMNWFDPDARSPLADVVPGFPDLRGGVRFVGVDRNPRTQYNIDGDNFAPRVGFAYQATEKTVVRAGYGHFYGPSNQAAQGTVGPFGFRTENLWVTSLDNGLTPFNTLRNPYPQGFRPVPGASEGLLTQAGANLQGVLQDTLAPMSMQWNLTVQRELPLNSLIEVGYVGNRGLHLFRSTESGLNLNQLDPRYMELGSRLNDRVPNPFSGIVDNGVLVGSTVSRAQLLRAYPQFTDIIPLYSSGASSNYHSLQITGRKRFSHGFQFEGSYTWAKIIDEGTQHQDSYNIRASRSLADHDIAHRFVMSYIYELPFGRGRRFGAGSSRVMDLLLGGW